MTANRGASARLRFLTHNTGEIRNGRAANQIGQERMYMVVAGDVPGKG